ncbi:hypothetical protein CCR75_000281 [Bremia lactucae]|uniref:Calcineurin-like phosphoesterase domain-containing protein n=1 Tax=Bremia lactucae TaxID=4779 RepID=A0A976FLE7_BRELC|nr:hypothetical protein CCR75_000281 [Bremia lactucae]
MLRLLNCALFATVSAATSVGQILHFSDVHLNITEPSSNSNASRIAISYFQDAPLSLLKSALFYAKRHVVADPELFLYTGDHVVHGHYSDEVIAKTVETNVRTIEDYFPGTAFPGTLSITAIIGNADENPDYHMEVTDPERELNPSIKLISDTWKDSFSPESMDLLNRRGYLSYSMDNQLEVITLNTVPYSPSHTPDTSNQSDPFGQFAWLDTTLARLEKAGKFAYITGHIAPIVDSYGGDPQWHSNYIVKYKKIVGRYGHVIKAQFFGHVHSIEFRVPVASLDEPNENAATLNLPPVFMTGSISPLFGNNPSFMVWVFNSETYEVLDYAVYGTDIRKSEPQLDWKLLFKASEAYGLMSLSLTELSSFVYRAEQNVSLLENYYWNMKARSPNAPPCQDAVCHVRTLCSLKWWDSKREYLACMEDTGKRKSSAAISNRPIANAETIVSFSLLDSSTTTDDVLVTIGVTTVAIVVTVLCVAVTVYLLNRVGILLIRRQYASV